ncbi:peptidase M50 [Devosia yakushimensis]|uniref:Peptidase M50 n=1 Tax=Devosia yakushimensis TaxID=470028 RepID=A0ABQ5UC46_9HYPH|nr:site-2 protease family protein [Devosia yakushimensis]GLQ08763.1 peptidase M50 [Devosia yakushimensis]
MSFDLSLQQIIMRVLAMLVVTGQHGFALAGIAGLLGDKGPRYDGRLTGNPFTHLDLFGLLAAVASLCGWIRPMRIDAAELRQGRLGLVICVVASLAVVVAVGVLLLQLKPVAIALAPAAASNQITAWLQILAEMSVVFAVINLVPLPPFTGGHILAAVAPRLWALVEPRVTIIAIALVVLAAIDRGAVVGGVLRPLVRALTS